MFSIIWQITDVKLSGLYFYFAFGLFQFLKIALIRAFSHFFGTFLLFGEWLNIAHNGFTIDSDTGDLSVFVISRNLSIIFYVTVGAGISC